MKKNTNMDRKPDPERAMALKSLPPHIREKMSDEEIELFLFSEEWPEELFSKLEEFIFTEKK